MSKKLLSSLPRKALTDSELLMYAEKFNIPHFRGVFMLDRLPQRPRRNETAIVNLDDSDGPGSHWVAYAKFGRSADYFDSFGLKPPPALIRYLRGTELLYNYDREQRTGTQVCGQLCLRFLIKETRAQRGYSKC